MGILGRVGEASTAGGGDHEGVLDADAAVLGEVDAGLDGHDVARCEGSSGRRRHPRVLVDVEADAVPGAVQEGIAPSGGGDLGWPAWPPCLPPMSGLPSRSFSRGMPDQCTRKAMVRILRSDIRL